MLNNNVVWLCVNQLLIIIFDIAVDIIMIIISIVVTVITNIVIIFYYFRNDQLQSLMHWCAIMWYLDYKHFHHIIRL